MLWIYLSPHLDDGVFSCGGIIWEQVQLGKRVEIWTLCAGDPPPGELTPYAQELHSRWQTGDKAVAIRREEDDVACQILGATPRHFYLPDCIYRRIPGTQEPAVNGEQDLWRELHPEELPLVDRLVADLLPTISRTAQIVSPLRLGGHVDHRLTRRVAERLFVRLEAKKQIYYADLPYVLRRQEQLVTAVKEMQLKKINVPISAKGLAAWQEAIAAYRSQVGTFWSDEAEQKGAIEQYWANGGGGVWARDGSNFPPFEL